MDEMTKWVERFQLDYPKLMRDMKACSHHYGEAHLNPYHLEGDVFTHTMMVVRNALSYARDGECSEDVVISSLLHDIGKLDAREVVHDRMRVRFIGHAGASFFRAITILKAWGFSKERMRRILEMISLHGEFYNFMEVNGFDRRKLVDRFQLNEDLWKETFWQIIADVNGRIASVGQGYGDDNVVGTEIIKRFEAERIQMKSAYAKYTEGLPTITLMIGPPNCGKSTWLERNVKDQIIVSRDEIITSQAPSYCNYEQAFALADHEKIDSILHERIKDLVKNKLSFVVDMTHVSRKSRRRTLANVNKGYKTVGVVFATGYETLLKRNVNREGKTIPLSVMKKMMENFMVPLYDEFDEIKWVFE